MGTSLADHLFPNISSHEALTVNKIIIFMGWKNQEEIGSCDTLFDLMEAENK